MSHDPERDAATQAQLILDHLLQGLSITPIEALQKFGCFRLGARIWDLRQQGYRIDREWETDGVKRWAKYNLVQA